MRRLLTPQIVYDYIKNYCYNPVYNVSETVIDETTDLDSLDIQFDSTMYYAKDAYCIYNGNLYLVLQPGSGPWSGNSISNLYLGEEVRTGEAIIADIASSEYDASRFKLIDIVKPITLYEVINARTQKNKMAFSNMRAARNYIRDYIDPALYVIKISKLNSNDGYLGEWDDHSMIFYGVV